MNKEDKSSEIMPREKAISLAEAVGLDLIEISKGDISVCIIAEYSKYMYDANKHKKDSLSKKVQTKEIRINDGIAEHDIMVKARAVSKILKEGDRIKISVIYKGRKQKYISSGNEVVGRLRKHITVEHIEVGAPRIEGNRYTLTVGPENKNR